ncbi:hypothetical protein BAGA_25880 [Bacillus gaemokensis]|uniref:EamA domain-containing protein n=1 Tax=Bacillus gaemokensis TaxID=574375 RepID=A0A073KBD8_9BACI|nr:hypothetical protein BAGA_25880 [Bacillus gaemokensis]KYG39467.1 hypothetical protein AZF08_05415 [Bacillus gaemokensis]
MRKWGIELLFLIVVIIWGINYTIAKYGLEEFTAIEFTALRMIAAAWAKEQISLQQIIGGVIIFLGLWFVKSEKFEAELVASEHISK